MLMSCLIMILVWAHFPVVISAVVAIAGVGREKGKWRVQRVTI